MELGTITIAARFHGPKGSSNGGYACGRVAAFIDGVARVRLRVPPPLDVPLSVERAEGSHVRVLDQERLIAEGWPTDFDLDVPPPPGIDEAREASKGFVGFKSHRFRTCFVCGVDREPPDGLRVFAGPVKNRDLVACTWTPTAELAGGNGHVLPVFLWSVLDCPGGFAFPHPEVGTILLGELSVKILAPVPIGQEYVLSAWEVRPDGRKHHTGTAIHSASGVCHGIGQAIWFEVPELPNQ